MRKRIATSFLLTLALAGSAAADVRKPTKPPTPRELTVEYQRVGRDIMKLQDQRGHFDVADLVPRFRAIKLDAAIATTTARAVLASTLAELASKIERLRGISVQQVCLDNPLADGCQ
jgi:hypothetical protein